MSKKIFISFVKVSILGFGILLSYSLAFSQFTDRSWVILYFDDTSLSYAPSSKSLNIIKGNHVLSYGDDWEKCNVRSGIFHLKCKPWNFYLEVNTVMKEVYKSTDSYFCRYIPKLDIPKNKLPFRVDVQGNPNNPSMFYVRFGDKVSLMYSLSLGQVSVNLAIPGVGLSALSLPSSWESCWRGGFKFHFKHKRWNYFWIVDTNQKKVWKGDRIDLFCDQGYLGSLLITGIRVEVRER